MKVLIIVYWHKADWGERYYKYLCSKQVDRGFLRTYDQSAFIHFSLEMDIVNPNYPT